MLTANMLRNASQTRDSQQTLWEGAFHREGPGPIEVARVRFSGYVMLPQRKQLNDTSSF